MSHRVRVALVVIVVGVIWFGFDPARGHDDEPSPPSVMSVGLRAELQEAPDDQRRRLKLDWSMQQPAVLIVAIDAVGMSRPLAPFAFELSTVVGIRAVDRGQGSVTLLLDIDSLGADSQLGAVVRVSVVDRASLEVRVIPRTKSVGALLSTRQVTPDDLDDAFRLPCTPSTRSFADLVDPVSIWMIDDKDETYMRCMVQQESLQSLVTLMTKPEAGQD